MKSPLEQFDIINVKLISILGIDFSYNNILIPFFLIILFISLFIYIYFDKFTIIPLHIQNIIENIYIFLISLIKQQTNTYGLF
jgi:F0F1-type ATP synthase membrane subunit a